MARPGTLDADTCALRPQVAQSPGARWWTPERVAELRRLRDDGLSFAKCGAVMGKTRSAIGAAVWYYILGNPWPRGPSVRLRSKSDVVRHVADWTDRSLTETWAERKARLARARAA